jgi:hypothetical protein
MPGLPKIVLERLRAKSAAPAPSGAPAGPASFQGGEHPDANLLAAFVERTLTERERRQVLNHLAQCAECRALMALTLPAKVDVAHLKRLPGRQGWRAWPTLRWGALVVALGAVAIVVVLHPYPARRQTIAAHSAGAESKQRVSLMATARPPVTVETENIPTVSRAHEISRREKATSVEAIPSAPSLARSAFKPSAAPEGTPKAATGAESQAAAAALRANAESVAVSTTLNAGLVAGVSPPSSTLSVPRAPALVHANSHQAKLPSMAFRAGVESAVAQPAALWSISPSGKVQRSDDGGKTWEEVPVDDRVTFRVIHAMGRDVWAGGSGGSVYHSGDGGVIWTRANLSSGGSPTTETIVVITSSSNDPQRITVRTVTGEQWTTEDGGQSWQREP